MLLTVDAVIFDMDGVLINSEHLWRKAMIRGFNDFGMHIIEADCRKTMGMRFGEVVKLWLHHFQIHVPPMVVERTVLNILLEYIEKEGQVINFIPELIELCKENNMKLGLATSSSTELMDAILKKLGYENLFDAKVSAENLKYGKPHPEVFLKCAEALGVDPSRCVVIEDSVNGVISAKAAQMLVIAVPDEDHNTFQQFAIADFKKDDMGDVLTLFKTMFQFRSESGNEPLEF